MNQPTARTIAAATLDGFPVAFTDNGGVFVLRPGGAIMGPSTYRWDPLPMVPGTQAPPILRIQSGTLILPSGREVQLPESQHLLPPGEMVRVVVEVPAAESHDPGPEVGPGPDLGEPGAELEFDGEPPHPLELCGHPVVINPDLVDEGTIVFGSLDAFRAVALRPIDPPADDPDPDTESPA